MDCCRCCWNENCKGGIVEGTSSSSNGEAKMNNTEIFTGGHGLESQSLSGLEFLFSRKLENEKCRFVSPYKLIPFQTFVQRSPLARSRKMGTCGQVLQQQFTSHGSFSTIGPFCGAELWLRRFGLWADQTPHPPRQKPSLHSRPVPQPASPMERTDLVQWYATPPTRDCGCHSVVHLDNPVPTPIPPMQLPLYPLWPPPIL